MCSGCPKHAIFGPAGGRAHRCGDCRIEGDVDVLSSICITCLAFTASYGSTSKGARRCAGCKLPGDVNKKKRLCRTCHKNPSEYGPTPRKKPTTCEACKTLGQHHRDSDWLWNMLVTQKPRKGKKRHKILWSDETLRDQLWWLLKPQKQVKSEVKLDPRISASSSSSASSSTSSSVSSSSTLSSSSIPASLAAIHQPTALVKIEPAVEDDEVSGSRN
jgi:hypothetical protein